MLILSVDLGKFKSVACVLDTSSNEHTFQTVCSTDGELSDLIPAYAVRPGRHRSLLAVGLGCRTVPGNGP